MVVITVVTSIICSTNVNDYVAVVKMSHIACPAINSHFTMTYVYIARIHHTMIFETCTYMYFQGIVRKE